MIKHNLGPIGARLYLSHNMYIGTSNNINRNNYLNKDNNKVFIKNSYFRY